MPNSAPAIHSNSPKPKPPSPPPLTCVLTSSSLVLGHLRSLLMNSTPELTLYQLLTESMPNRKYLIWSPEPHKNAYTAGVIRKWTCAASTPLFREWRELPLLSADSLVNNRFAFLSGPLTFLFRGVGGRKRQKNAIRSAAGRPSL